MRARTTSMALWLISVAMSEQESSCTHMSVLEAGLLCKQSRSDHAQRCLCLAAGNQCIVSRADCDADSQQTSHSSLGPGSAAT